MQFILGTRTSSDVNLVAQILMIVGLWIGFYFARTRQIPKHRNVQTTVVIANTFFILLFMMTSFYAFVIRGGATSGSVATLMIVHGILGLVAELAGIYLVLRMRTQLIPQRFRVRNFKLVMRSLLGLWTILVILGLGIYYYRYLAPRATATDASLTRLQQAADDIAMHADEVQSAARRGNLATAKRHAEHLVNLIEGKNGGDYGDLDRDGSVQDPGDGTGAINILRQVRDAAGKAGGNGSEVTAVVDQVREQMVRVIADAKTILQASDVNSVMPAADDIAALAGQLDKGGAQSVAQIVTLLNANVAPPAAVAASAPNAPGTVVVNLKDFAFVPKTLTVNRGTTVVFVNQDPAKHTVTEDNGKFDSKDMLPGQTFSVTLDVAGTYPYYCVFHGDKGGVDMAGTIIVQP